MVPIALVAAVAAAVVFAAPKAATADPLESGAPNRAAAYLLASAG